MNIDDFIKWTGDDGDGGTVTYHGQVKMFHGETVIFEDSEGVMYGVPKDDGTFRIIKKPKGWNRPKSTMTVVEPKPTKRTKSMAVTKGEKALTITRDLYGKGHGKDATIQRIMDVCNMSKAGATTYFYKSKKVVDQGS